MNRYQIRQEVRRIIRDEVYPAEQIDDAINSVLLQINNMGRFRFHQSYDDITLVAGTFKYDAMPTAAQLPYSLLGEEMLVLNPESTSAVILRKGPALVDALAQGFFSTSGTPSQYIRWGDEFWFNPIPAAADAAKVVRVYNFKDLTALTSDLSTPAIPERFHRGVLAYGAAAQINPALEEQQKTINDIFQANVKYMIQQELWEPLTTHQLMVGDRFRNAATWGNVSKVRG